MNLITKAGVAIAAFCSFAAPLQAGEGFLMVERTVTGTRTRTSQVQLERDRMRAEITGPTGETQILIFDAPQQVLRVISPDRKTYTEVTKADADRMGAQLNAAIAGIKEKLAAMPPEQRAKMEAAMSRLGGAGAAGKPEYRRAGSDKVGKWTCDRYEGFRNGEKVAEVCTVEPEVLGLTLADFAVGRQMASFFRSMSPTAEEQIVGIGTVETQGFPGVPVRRIRYGAGKVQTTSEVLDMTPQTFAASTYDVPAGFTKKVFGVAK